MELEAGEALVNLMQKFASGVKPCFISREVIPRERAICGQSFREIRVDAELSHRLRTSGLLDFI